MSISDGFIETNSCSVVLTHLSLMFLAGGLNTWVIILKTRNKLRAHVYLGILGTQKTIQMALASDFSICSDDWIWNLQHGVCATAICWAFLTKGQQNESKKSPQSMLQSLSKDAEQNSIKTSCLGCPRLNSTAQKAISKIILHRIISVVWLTNFLSEIRSLSNHDDAIQFRILSVKLQCFWSLMIAHCSIMSSDGWGIVWVAYHMSFLFTFEFNMYSNTRWRW